MMIRMKELGIFKKDRDETKLDIETETREKGQTQTDTNTHRENMTVQNNINPVSALNWACNPRSQLSAAAQGLALNKYLEILAH